jgi:hypothetical protein
MPLFIEIEDGIKVEISDDGAISFPNYDIERDLMKVDLLGEEKSPAVEFIEAWEESPLETILLKVSSTSALVEIGKAWIEEVFDILRDVGCIDTEEMDLEKWAALYEEHNPGAHASHDAHVRALRWHKKPTASETTCFLAYEYYKEVIRWQKEGSLASSYRLTKNALLQEYIILLQALEECNRTYNHVDSILAQLLILTIQIAQEHD